jgi:hypothetical protein
MASFVSGRAAAAVPCLLLAALAMIAVDAQAKGRRGGGSFSRTTSQPDADDKASGGGFKPQVNLRPSNSSSQGAQQPALGTGLVPLVPAAGAAGAAAMDASPVDQEEAERRAARQAAAEREAAQRAAAEKAVIEAQRLAAEKAAADAAAARSTEERLQAARAAAAREKKQREEAVIASDVDRVMQRALADYPVLKTPEGAGMLRQIVARQKELEARGMYPSVALVEAVADHAQSLAPRPRETAMAPAAPAAADSRAIGNCRWVSPTQWSCK